MASDDTAIFPERFGLESTPTVDSDFPETARIGIWHVLQRFVEKNSTEGWQPITQEVLRLHRTKRNDISGDPSELMLSELLALKWTLVYIFCERVYALFLTEEERGHDINGNPLHVIPVEEVRRQFEADVNQVMAEESIAYRMREGKFYRPGRLHSQKVSARAALVLADPTLREARSHFSKAKRFFEAVPEPDFPNAVKEAVAALEAAVRVLFPARGSDLESLLRKVRDGAGQPIPPTIVKGILSPYQFRGAGQAVAHGGATGGVPTPEVSEWVTTVVAASIIYLRDIALSHEDEPPPF